MKRTLSFLLAVLTALSLTACKPKDSGPDSALAESPALQSAPPVQTKEPVPDKETVIENLVLTDNDVCSFKIISVDAESVQGYALAVYLENKLNVPLTFSIDDASLNGYMCSPYWSMQLEPKTGEEAQVLWYSTDLKLNDIETVWAIELTLRTSRDDTEDDAYSELFEIYPNGDSVSALATEPRQPKRGDTVLVETDDFTFTITEFNAETAFAYAVNVYLENNSGKNVFFTLDTAKLNGYDCNPYWAIKVPEGKRANAFVSWMDYDLDLYGIANVNEIEFVLKIYDADDWAALPLFNKTFTVTP